MNYHIPRIHFGSSKESLLLLFHLPGHGFSLSFNDVALAAWLDFGPWLNGAPWCRHSILKHASKYCFLHSSMDGHWHTLEASSHLAHPSLQKQCDPVTIQHLECSWHALDFKDPSMCSGLLSLASCLAQSLTRWTGVFEVTFPLLFMSNMGMWPLHDLSGHNYGNAGLPATKTKHNGDWLLFTDQSHNQCLPASGPLSH